MVNEVGTIGRYRLLEEVGRGGMGVVFRAEQLDLGRTVALKMILSSHLASEDAVRRFRVEATAAARVRHPNVVDVYEVGELNGQHFISMEFVTGRSLADTTGSERMDFAEIARCMQQVADSVHHLHAQGIVHRDLKPSNILLDADGRPRVTDFGLATMADSEGLTTDSGAIVGTPGYMAPEIVLGPARGDARSDIYSLGAILYELLTGQPLFEREAAVRTLLKVMGADPKPPSMLRPDVPKGLEQICLKCLHKDPDRRYATASELAEDLARFSRGEPVEGLAPNVWHAIYMWMRRKPGLAARLGGLVVCYLLHVLILVSGADPEVDSTWSLQLGGIFLFWGGASFGLQRLLDRGYRSGLVHRLWIGTDILCLTGLLLTIADGPASAIVSAYPVIIVMSGIWFDARLVWFATGLAVLGYTTLVLDAELRRVELAFQDKRATYLILVTFILLTGFFVAQQARRMSALTRFCGR